MSIKKLSIPEFLERCNEHPVIDVRSPGEYSHAHIPGAVSMPLFDDEERRIVGTAYKQTSREAAIKIGLDFFGPKMRKMVEEVEEIKDSNLKHPNSNLFFKNSNLFSQNSNLKNQKSNLIFHNSNPEILNSNLKNQSSKSIIVHCWRGGMRSGAVAWLLDMYGFDVYLLVGGYKAFRRWVLQQFFKDYNFRLIGGYTGSGKTIVLQEMKHQNQPVLDLENLAQHKGSAFGGLDMKPQPSTEMFENLLAMNLFQLTKENPQQIILTEDESQRIGMVNLPSVLWQQLRRKPLFFLDIPFEERLNYLVKEYGIYSKEELAKAIERIQKRLGGLETKIAINALADNNIKACFEVLLKYYDKHYLKGLHNRNNTDELLQKIELPTVAANNATTILNFYNQQQHV